MKSYPKDSYDFEELANLRVKDWQVELLKLNPSYVYWEPGDDYMSGENGSGWSKGMFYDTWELFKKFSLDDLNEIVHFFFFLHRDNHICPDCDGEGVNKETLHISKTFYDFDGTGQKWRNSITQDEVLELVKAGRLRDLVGQNCHFNEEKNQWEGWVDGVKVKVDAPEIPLASAVNKWNQSGIGHDAINRWILIETRAKRLGVYGECPKCGKNGVVYDEPDGKLGVVFWIIHPRKGASKGAKINEVNRGDLPEVFQLLKEARSRNNQRFDAVCDALGDNNDG